MKYKKIIAIILALIIFSTMFTACGNSGPRILDFENYSERNLRKYEGDEVTIYGYLGLNAVVGNMAYFAPLPYMAILNNEMKDGEHVYINITMQDSKLIPVFFKEIPKYTTAPIKITGILKRVEGYDDVLYVSYPYAITDATMSDVETFSFAPGFKEFAFFAKAGYPDVVYQNLLNLEMYATGHMEEFPKEENYENIKKDFQDAQDLSLYKDYLNHLEKTHQLFVKYAEQKKDGKLDFKKMGEETSELITSFIKMMDKYASFKVVRNKDKGIIILEPTENVLTIPDDTRNEPTLPTSSNLQNGDKIESDLISPQTTPTETIPN